MGRMVLVESVGYKVELSQTTMLKSNGLCQLRRTSFGSTEVSTGHA
jgi:hypothetical protein